MYKVFALILAVPVPIVEIEIACGLVSVKNQTKSHFSIYPNPANGFIIIAQSENSPQSHLTILNLSGQEILHQTFTKAATNIDISALPQGVYFVRLHNEKMVEVNKMVKE